MLDLSGSFRVGFSNRIAQDISLRELMGSSKGSEDRYRIVSEQAGESILAEDRAVGFLRKPHRIEDLERVFSQIMST